LPVAVNCWPAPSAIEEAVGVTVIDSNDGLTVRRVEPLILPLTALMVVVPAAEAVARPCVPTALLIVATVADVELHVTD
jgi:hypothetical protein